MASLRLNPVIRSLSSIRPSTRTSSLSIYASQRRLYPGSNYGGGEGDPKGENPLDQGSNPSADLEHPGPPPPDVGKGTGGGPTKKGAEGHNTRENASSSGQGGNEGSKGREGGPQPKIHNHNAPAEEHHSEEVRKHNEDMGKRYDRPQEKSPDKEDKVNKPYWSGPYPSILGIIGG